MNLNLGLAGLPWPRQALSVGAFLAMALALLPHSSYAWGGTVVVLVTLLTIPSWARQRALPPGTWMLALAMGLMGLVWLYGSDFGKGASVYNKPSRYFFALPCLFCLVRYPPQRQWLLAGIVCGAALGGLFALYDTLLVGHDRPWISATSTSSAIQLGNLCGLFALICWLQLVLFWQRWGGARRLLVLVALALALLGLLLSQSRGGWLALALCAPVLLGLLAFYASWRRALASVALLLAVMLPAVTWQSSVIAERVELAVQEVLDYEQDQVSDNSVGHRLEHWRVAWAMGLQKPLGGWGDAGYEAEKARLVAAGQAKPEILRYGHAHNELLDQFAKRGLVGVGGLLLLYGLPLVVFWPRRQLGQIQDSASADKVDRLVLRLAGVAVPLAFIGFGLTQVFFAHYNGIIIYLLFVLFLFAALHAPAAPARSDVQTSRASCFAAPV